MAKLKDTYFGHESMSKTARVLRLLREKGEADNRELNKIAFRYGSIIHELRKEGWKIVSVPLDTTTGRWKFVMLGHTDELSD